MKAIGLRSATPPFLAALALLWPAAASSAAAEHAPVRADRDGDRVFEDLERRLARTPGDRRVQVIVSLTRAASRERVARIQRSTAGLQVGRRFTLVDAFTADVPAGRVRDLARQSGVRHVELDGRVRALNSGAQRWFGVTAAREQAPSLDGDRDGNAASHSPADLVAAVIDTGIDAGHADLDEGKVLAFKDYVNGRTAPYDDEGHGTHVAATIAGDGDGTTDGRHRGVAPAAGLVGVKVLDQTGSGLMSDVTAAIEWVVAGRTAHGTEVINLSLGASGCSDGTDATSQAVDAAQGAGIVVAAAAGNEGPGTCTIGAPGAAAGAITVGAMADADARGFRLARFSSRGPTADGRVKPDLVGPGVSITSAAANTASGYSTYSGTSMATPFVAGVALLALDADPTLTPSAIRTHLRTTAVDWARGGDNRTANSTGADIDYGAGRLDAHAALSAAGAPLGTAPAIPLHRSFEGSLGATGAVADHQVQVVDTAMPLAATLTQPSITAESATSPNLDLRLLDPQGNQVASSATSWRQEDIGHQPASTGTYTLRVVSAQGAADYVLDVSAADTDTTPPETTLVSTPLSLVSSTLATFGFTSSEGGSTFECRVDGGGWNACASPSTQSVSGDGGHTFQVRARDGAGNVDPTPASASWTVDTVAPDTQIALGPTGTVSTREASFVFASLDLGARFECRLASAAWETCSSPKAYSALPDGTHRFSVRAVDEAGNADASPAVREWTVLAGTGTNAPDADAGTGQAAPATDAGTSADGPAPAKLQLRRAGIRSGRLDVLAPISRRASGRVDVTFHAAGRRTRFRVPVDSDAGYVRFTRRLPRAQVRAGTGIVTLGYPGNAATRAEEVRLRAASRPSRLRARRPVIRSGRLRAEGTVSARARGVVRVRLSYLDAGRERLVEARARIRDGRWRLSASLPRAAREGGHASILFTGDHRAGMRGEMRSYAVHP